MNLTLLRVTQRIAERSKQTRSEYLARIHQAKSDTVHRSQLACGCGAGCANGHSPFPRDR
jgi:phosphogluconate dehydratase